MQENAPISPIDQQVWKNRPLWSLVLGYSLAWVALLFFFSHIIHYDRWNSDVVLYWNQSQQLEHFDVWHVPAYAFLIYVGSIVVPVAPPLLIMSSITYITWLLSGLIVYSIFKTLRVEWPWQGAFVFSFFPLIGLTYSVYPIAESLARFCVVGVVLLYLKHNKWSALALMAIGLLAQKTVWPYVLGVALVGLYEHRFKLWEVVLVGIPLIIYIVLGSFYHDDIFWIITDIASAGGAGKGLPFVDVMFGGLLSGAVPNMIKSIMIIGLFGLVALLFVGRSWREERVLLPLILSPLFFFITTNANASMVVIRASVFIIIPVWFHFFRPSSEFKNWLGIKQVLLAIMTLEVLSQFAFAYYIPIFFRNR